MTRHYLLGEQSMIKTYPICYIKTQVTQNAYLDVVTPLMREACLLELVYDTA